PGDRLSRLDRATACEDREALERVALCFVEEVIAPVDRRAQRAMALGGVARARVQQRESRLEPAEHDLWCEKFRASCSQLDCEGQSIELSADRIDGIRALVITPLWVHGTRPHVEERDRVSRRER